MRNIVSIIILLTVFSSSLCAAEGTQSDSGTLINPHTEIGNCQVCHVASEEDLKSWFTFTSTKKTMKGDLNSICQQCHGVEFGHGIGKWTKHNKDGLPMDDRGYIACAITCHDMHGKSSDYQQNKFHLRAPSMKLCLSCHDQ